MHWIHSDAEGLNINSSMDSEGSIWNVGSIWNSGKMRHSWIKYLLLFFHPSESFQQEMNWEPIRDCESTFLKLFYWLDPFLLAIQSKSPFSILPTAVKRRLCPIYSLICKISIIWLVASFRWIGINCPCTSMKWFKNLTQWLICGIIEKVSMFRKALVMYWYNTIHCTILLCECNICSQIFLFMTL